eukprot:m.307807 g.307807  ORF g.307807 m.307807 type:complete len:428 (-) comp20514_c0_seq1:156-1439(-)
MPSKTFSKSVHTTTTVERTVIRSGDGSRTAAASPRPTRTIAARAAPRLLEVVLSFDTTGSMYSYLEKVRENLAAIVRKLADEAEQNDMDLRLGVIAHGDYCDKQQYYVIKFLQLRDVKQPSQRGEILRFIGKVGPTGGGDAPECYELALHQARTKMNWTPGSRRILVIVGDDAPHPPGYTYGDYTNTLDWEKEVAELGRMGVRTYTVDCGSSGLSFWRDVATKTRGQLLPIQEMRTLSHLIIAAALREMSTRAFRKYHDELARTDQLHGEMVTIIRLIEKVVVETEIDGRTGIVSQSRRTSTHREVSDTAAAVAVAAAAAIENPTSRALKAAPRTSRICFAYNEGTCHKGSSCSYRHKKICKFFNEGKCTKRDCTFEHVKICFFFNDSGCRNGSRCPFAHVTVCSASDSRNCRSHSCKKLHIQFAKH